jgi:polar amino acid transport system substrate-binding protein
MSLKSVLSLFAATLLPLVAAPPAVADKLEDIIQSGLIKIAVPADFPPFGSIGKDGQAEGYDVEVAKLVARDLGVRLELVPVTSPNRVAYLLTGKVDLVISSLGANPERAKVIAFTDAYAPFYAGVFGDAKTQIRSAADLAGKTIGVTRGTIEDAELARLAPKSATIQRFEDNNMTLSALATGKVDVIATGSAAAGALARSSPGKAEKKFVLRDSPAHIGVRKDEPDLVAWLNVFIHYHQKSGGELDALAQKWLGESLAGLPSF